MTAATTAQGYGDGIIHPVTRLSSLQRHTMTLLHPQTPHSSHPARNPRRRDIIATPFAVRTDAVFAVKDDDKMASQTNSNPPARHLCAHPRRPPQRLRILIIHHPRAN